VRPEEAERPEDAEPPEGSEQSERPRPSRRTLTLIVTPLVAIFAMSTFGNAIHPQLLNSHPLWLIAMEPRLRYLLLVANKVQDTDKAFLPFLVIAVGRRLLSDPLYYLLGHLYGDAGVRWAEKRLGEGGMVIRFVERWFGRAAPVMVFCFPGPLVCLMAGATGMSVPMFITLNLVGTFAAVTLSYYAAGVIKGPLDAVNNFYAHNGRWLLVVSVVITLGWVVMQQRSGKGELRSVSEIERELEEEAAREPDPE
jgi:membrane protein DedA with SNARE-associated domain